MENCEKIQEIPPLVLKNLGDRTYDKRKTAASEIQAIIHQMNKADDHERILNIIQAMCADLAISNNESCRKGLLIGLACCAIGIGTNISKFLDYLVPPVLTYFKDNDSRIRFYACEALFNVCKTARSQILPYFIPVFNGLCELYSDLDIVVKEAAKLLDKLLREIVTEYQTFDIDSFIPVLQRILNEGSPYSKVLAMSWIDLMNNVPGIDIVFYLPFFLEGLFKLLSDKLKDIRQDANSLLESFLFYIKKGKLDESNLETMMQSLITLTSSSDSFTRQNSIFWITIFIPLQIDWGSLFVPILNCLLTSLSEHEHSLEDSTDVNSSRSVEQCLRALNSLMGYVEKYAINVDLDSLINIILGSLSIQTYHTSMFCIKFAGILLRRKDCVETYYDAVMAALLEKLKVEDRNDVIVQSIHVMIDYLSRGVSLSQLLTTLLKFMEVDSAFMETRALFIIRVLCQLLTSAALFSTYAEIIPTMDKSFAESSLQLFNVILLTTEDTQDMRKILRGCCVTQNADGVKLFDKLYPAWSLNSMSVLSLCWLVEAYGVAYEQVKIVSSQPMSLPILLQADKLCQLVESPVFIHLRLRLIDGTFPQIQPLLQSLFGLFMLMPQSASCKQIQNRLTSITPLHNAIAKISPSPQVDSTYSIQKWVGIFQEKQKERLKSISATSS